MSRVLITLLLLVLPSRAGAALVLNEVLYDPPGSDGGHEFVELYNAGSENLSLDGVRLVFVNGADPQSPRTLWEAPTGLVLAAAAFLVLGESEVTEADLTLDLGIQNGPDALRLSRGEELLDRVAWGDLEGLGEGSPAPDPSGTSLGRVPDGNDSDDNRTDWQALPRPSPGRPNARAEHLEPRLLEAEPPWRGDPGVVRLELLVVAGGYADRQGGLLRWRRDGEELARESLSLGREESLRAALEIALDSGSHELEAEIESEGELTTRALPFRVGPTETRLSEIMVRPRAGAPEWIELRHLGVASDTLRAWSFCDATRDWRAIPELRWSSAGFALLTSDAAGLRERFALPPQLPVLEPEGGWPSLNNSDSREAGFADEILLRDAEGRVVDHLRYRQEDLPEPGRTLERVWVSAGRAHDWSASPGEPTPGEENLTAAYPPPDAGLSARPDPFTPDGDGIDDLLHVQLRGAPSPGNLVAEIRDLAGERVAELGIDSAESELHQWLWDGRDLDGRPVPLGAYVVVVRAGGGESPPRAWRALVALGRRR